MSITQSSHHLSRREFLKLGGAALLAALAGKTLTAAAEGEEPPVLWYASRISPYAALTYDDCYLVHKMQDLETILAGYPEVKITLFPVGKALDNNEGKDPGIWRRFLEQGHEYGYHTFDHLGAHQMTTKMINEDYDRWHDALARVLGTEPKIKFYRPTFGVVTPSLLEMCQQRGLIPTMWSRGWGGKYEVSKRAIRETQAGDIVLLHIRTDDVYNTSQGLEVHKDSPLRFVTMSSLYRIYLSDQEKIRQHPRR